MIQLELLNDENEQKVLAIEREDIPEQFAESMTYTIALSHYGTAHALKGFCFAIKYYETYVGLVLIGEAIENDADPVAVKGSLYFRIIGFVIDRRYRGKGIGRQALTLALQKIHCAYGNVPVILECHRDNRQAIRFYEKIGFVNTNKLHEDNYYMIKTCNFVG